MNRINLVENIHIPLPEKQIFARLKYNIHKTEMDPAFKKKIASIMNKGYNVCRLSGVWTVVDINSISGNKVVFPDGITIDSTSIAGFLSESSSAVFMGVTAGPGISSLASEAVEKGDGASAVILDAVGSETAEAAMDWLNGLVRREIRRKGGYLTDRRFSPGYGDFNISYQSLFFKLLQLEKMGVRISESCMLIPEKTVTAIAGIK